MGNNAVDLPVIIDTDSDPVKKLKCEISEIMTVCQNYEAEHGKSVSKLQKATKKQDRTEEENHLCLRYRTLGPLRKKLKQAEAEQAEADRIAAEKRAQLHVVGGDVPTNDTDTGDSGGDDAGSDDDPTEDDLHSLNIKIRELARLDPGSADFETAMLKVGPRFSKILPEKDIRRAIHMKREEFERGAEEEKRKKRASPEFTGFECVLPDQASEKRKAGVYMTDDDGSEEWLCTPVEVIAYTHGGDKSHGRQLRIHPLHGKPFTWTMYMRDTQNHQRLMSVLKDKGVLINFDMHTRHRVNYLTGVPDEVYSIVEQPGWHGPVGEAFMLPGHSIGTEKTILANTTGTNIYEPHGTYLGWQDWINRVVHQNPTLLFSLSAALTGPLLRILCVSGGGYHFVGPSSIGKSTLGYVGCSVWGKPEDYKCGWDASNQGIPASCIARNDTLIYLDELKRARHTLGNDVYAIANGEERSRNERKADGGYGVSNKRTWKIIMLSSGEITLIEKLKEIDPKTRIDGGQLVRFCDIQIERTHGVFDDIESFRCPEFDGHTRENELVGEAMAQWIEGKAADHCGHAGPEFIRKLINSRYTVENLHARWKQISGELDRQGKQEGRIADRFAAVALAGELAIEFGIFAGKRGDATGAMKVIYKMYLNTKPRGDNDETKILKHITEYIQLNRHKFVERNAGDLGNKERMGLTDRRGDINGCEDGGEFGSPDDEIFLMSVPEFEKMLLAGSCSKEQTIKLLEEKGWIAKYGRGESDGAGNRKRLPYAPIVSWKKQLGRHYHLDVKGLTE